MKKSLIALSIALLAISAVATPAFAKDRDDDDNGNRGRALGKIFKQIEKIDRDLPSSQFMVIGTIASTGTSSFVVNAQNSVHVPNLTNGQATIVVNSSTKYTANKNETAALSNLVAGDKVVVTGQVTGTTLTATNVHIKKEVAKNKKVMGKVTAKTTDTVTITNSLTNTSQTVTVDADTQVKINGETKTIADIAVGDSGWVKLKSKAGVMVAKIINLFR